jgi:hypothetical protein
VDLIPAFACGLGFGLMIGVALGLAWAAWGWLDTAYRHGLDDADAGWKAAMTKDEIPGFLVVRPAPPAPEPFRCNAVPLTPPALKVVK